MWIHIVLLVFLFISSFLSNNKSISRTNSAIVTFALIFFVAISGLRADSIGLDTEVYRDFFLDSDINLGNLLTYTRFEPLYVAINVVISKFLSFDALKLLVTFVYLYGVFRLCDKYSTNIMGAFLFFYVWGFYYLSFNEMRQAMAMGVFCLNQKNIVEGKLKEFIIMSLLAMGFHYSAIITLPIYLFRYLRLNKKLILISVVLFAIIQSYCLLFFDYMNSFVVNTFGHDEETGGWGLLYVQILTLSLGVILKKYVNNNAYMKVSFFMILYSVLLFPICHLNPAMFRLEQYSWICMIVFVPNLLMIIKNPIIKNIGFLCFAILGCVLCFNSYYTVDNQIFPHKFFWQ